MRRGKGLDHYQAIDYHNRIELCLAHVNSGILQKMRIENSGIPVPDKLISIRKLCIEAVDIFLKDFDGADHKVVEVAYYRRLKSKGKSNLTTVTKY